MADYIELGIGSIKDLFNYLTAQSKGKDVVLNALLRELRDNIKLLEHRNSEGVNVQAMIDNLSAASIEEAYKTNFNFNKLVHKKILPENLILHKKQLKYVGWDGKKFIYSIEGKIKDIKNLPKLFTDLSKAPINLPVRFDNLFYQMVLFTVFIRKSDS
ncbi:MAG: hypothetical protein H7Y00_01860 [Fimbriimonadaceae bacterium]|nr:hypothetical protein [Chitinophagales bacterium]